MHPGITPFRKKDGVLGSPVHSSPPSEPDACARHAQAGGCHEVVKRRASSRGPVSSWREFTCVLTPMRGKTRIQPQPAMWLSTQDCLPFQEGRPESGNDPSQVYLRAARRTQRAKRLEARAQRTGRQRQAAAVRRFSWNRPAPGPRPAGILCTWGRAGRDRIKSTTLGPHCRPTAVQRFGQRLPPIRTAPGPWRCRRQRQPLRNSRRLLPGQGRAGCRPFPSLRQLQAVLAFPVQRIAASQVTTRHLWTSLSTWPFLAKPCRLRPLSSPARQSA